MNHGFTPALLTATLLAGGASAQFNFTPSEQRLDVGRPGEWNDQDVLNPTVLHAEVFSGFSHTMYYVGHGGPYGHGPERHIVGVAKSTDGVTWERHPTALLGVGPPGAWDAAGRIHMCVTRHPGAAFGPYRMYYSASDGYESVATTRTNIGVATSFDGLTFTKMPLPVLITGADGEWDDAAVFACSVLSPAESPSGLWEMWYTGASDRLGTPSASVGIGVARSADGLAWMKDAGNPIFELSGGSPAGGYFYQPVVRFLEGEYHMWVTKVTDPLGTPIRSVHWYKSADGESGWTGPDQRHGGVLRFAHEACPQWDSAASALHLWHVRQDGGGTHPWYGGTYDDIAVATAPIWWDHPGEPYLLTSTMWGSSLPVTLELSDARAPVAPFGLMIDLAINTAPISVPTPFGVFALQSPVTVLTGLLDASGYTSLLLPGHADPHLVGLAVNFQALVANAPTLAGMTDAFSNPMTVYLVD